uniref:T9SS type A sorting domain-containing protein n=1 Tax=candidate division WOR-3 bacterium TaxID=2052148 RepID=A0A7C4TEL7_UNCW3
MRLKDLSLLSLILVFMYPLSATTIFSDDMTNFPTNWTLSGTSGQYWTKSSARYYSASYSAKCTPNATYSNNVDVYMERSINLSGYSSATLTFYIWQYTEANYDYVYVQYYTSSWTTAWSRSGSYQSWQQISVNIPTTATKIRFWFHSDYSVTYEGAYIDNVVLDATGGGTAQNDAGSGGDAGNTFETALLINPGNYTGYMDGSDRDDYYKFNVNSGQVIKVKLTPPSSADFDLYLYNPSNQQKASSLNGTGAVDSVTFTADVSGQWRARMYEYSGSGTYSFSVTLSSGGGGSTKEWTIMVYMNADNNLETYGIQDFNEMEAGGGSNSNRNVVVQIDRIPGYDNSNGDWTGCRRYYVTSDNNSSTINSTLIQDLGEVDMGSPTTLVQFVQWAKQNYPANKYFLVLWDHGDGWYLASQPNDAILFRGFSNDETSGNAIDVANGELNSALSQIKSALGKNIDLVGWDACLMGMWEVMDITKNYANILVSSEETEGGAGWYYTSFLNDLNNNPTMSALDLGKAVVNGTSGQSTLDVTDLSQIATLTTKIDAFANQLIQARGQGYSNTIQTARNNTKQFYLTSHIDLYDFADKIYNSTSLPTSLRNAATDVKNAILNAVKLYKNSSSYSMCRGVAIYHPSSSSGYNTSYNSLPITSTKWDEYLKGESGGGGVDYTVSQVTYSWISTSTATGITGDDQSKNFTLPFSFSFYGTSYNSVNICSNGFLSFTSTSTAYNPATIPNSADPNALIAPFWRDLNPAGGGTITYYSGSDKFVVTWNAVKNYSNSNTQTFEVILYPNGEIVFQYNSVTNDVTTSRGIENQSGSSGKTINAPSNGTAWKFTPTSGFYEQTNNGELRVENNLPRDRMIICYPNPASGSTIHFVYRLETVSDVKIRIYNLLGQIVQTIDEGIKKPGFYYANWSPVNLPDGIYFYRFTTNEKEFSEKIMLLRQ